MKTHELKTFPSNLDAIISGIKTFEVRLYDRDYRVGDVLVLKEWWNDVYLGRAVRRQIVFIQPGWGLEDGYVVLGLSPYNIIMV